MITSDIDDDPHHWREFVESNFHAYRGFMLLISALMFCAIWLMLTRTRLGLVIQAALTHPEMVGALGVNQAMLFTGTLFLGAALAGELPEARVGGECVAALAATASAQAGSSCNAAPR